MEWVLRRIYMGRRFKQGDLFTAKPSENDEAWVFEGDRVIVVEVRKDAFQVI